MPAPYLNKSFYVALLSGVVLAGVSGTTHAAGFYIQEQSVRGLGYAFAGSTTNLGDASTIYFNPAGMTKLAGTQAQAGVNLLIPSSKLTDTGSTLSGAPITSSGNGGNPYDPTPVPNGFFSHELGSGFWVGVGVTAPFGLANEYNDNWFGRYDSTKTELTAIDIQPTIAYQVNDMLSVGVGLNIQHADADLRSAVTNGVTEGESRLTGDDWGFGYTIGVQAKPFERTTLGVSYRSEIHYQLDGKLDIAGVAGLNESSGASANLNLPDQLALGMTHQCTDRLSMSAQATWFGWNNFEKIQAIRDVGTIASTVTQNYQTTWAFAVGGEYMLNDAWTLRAGIQYDETPTTDEYRTSRTPDGDRTWVSTGATWGLTDKIDLDLAATYIHISEETIDVRRNANLARVRADTEGHVGILALGMTYKF